MEKLPAVESAKMLMTEAMNWSVMKWLREKKQVRAVADKANAALDQIDLELERRWHKELRASYHIVGGDTSNGKGPAGPPQGVPDAELKLLRKIREANDAAARARTDAEQTFDEAERQLSTRLAREGCRKAIHSWELYEQAIQITQTLMQSK